MLGDEFLMWKRGERGGSKKGFLYPSATPDLQIRDSPV
jgi:hypothetical protein